MTTTSDVKRIYFDITDIVEYARVYNHVSGIQRVQIRIIAALAKQHGGKRIVCSYWNRATSTYCQVPGDGVFTSSAFNSTELLLKLRASTSHWLLDKSDAKKALAKYNGQKQYRALKKLELYLTALLWPAGLKRFGIQPKQSFNHIRPLEVQQLTDIPANETLVFLGSNWNTPELLEVGKRHRQAGGQVVQMIYDLIPHTAPQYFTQGLVNAFNQFLDSTPQYVSSFTCISDWTASDLRQFVQHIPGYAPLIQTVPLAHEFAGFARNQDEISPTDASLIQMVKQRPYVVCVGTVEVRKNGLALLQAWQRLIGELGERTPQLVFGGKYGWKIDEFKDLLKRDAQLARYVTIIANASDQDLAYLYKHCAFNIYPSFYEGWGLPVGEAAWFGRTSVVSSATSMPEVCGDLVDYVDPNDIQAIADKVKHFVLNPEIVKQREQRIREAPLRDWLTVANDFYDFVMADSVSLGSQAA
ncbi:glycosyltransferase involved in cell wall biosynthesis [Aquabacterium commune]|uniref:Glycosyltransferase involved in cell wall biosynthesis n=1 Tax=Aquabacterium commune TaxID=70586 RepID=A0A4R6RP68_9BURK|nr:glycosyltransferase family 1 protein [Aquabacterium commune]TDP88460.1 glycosyltransferase involved in cell wall biosynthesis [Aquabacterium commune]